MYKKIILCLIFLCSLAEASELHFRFYDKSNGTPIPFSRVDLILKNNIFSLKTSKEPNDSSITIPDGKNIVYIYCNAYVTYTDTLLVTEENSIIHKDYYLEKAWIKSTKAMEEYQQKLDEFAKKEPLLTFTLDSVSFGKEFAFFNFSFTNNSMYTIYIVKTIGCIEPIKITLEREDGRKLKMDAHHIDCVGEKVYPDNSDLIKISPRSKIEYPKIKRFFISDLKLKPGDNIFTAVYEYLKPNYYSGFSCPQDYRETRKEEIEAMIKAVRGKFYSNEYLIQVKN